MSFIVTGTLEGRMYRATWQETSPDDVDLAFQSNLGGLRPLLAAHEGDEFGVTPTGPFLALDFADGASVMAALSELTDVVEVEGDVPGVPEDVDVPADAIF